MTNQPTFSERVIALREQRIVEHREAQARLRAPKTQQEHRASKLAMYGR